MFWLQILSSLYFIYANKFHETGKLHLKQNNIVFMHFTETSDVNQARSVRQLLPKLQVTSYLHTIIAVAVTTYFITRSQTIKIWIVAIQLITQSSSSSKPLPYLGSALCILSRHFTRFSVILSSFNPHSQWITHKLFYQL